MTFNPNSPNTLGLEYFPYQEGLTSLASASQGVGIGVVSSAAQTVTGLYVPTLWSGPTSGYGRLWVDTHDMTTPPSAGAITELVYSPNEDKARSNTTRSDFFTTSSLYTTVNDTDDSGPPEATDYIVNSNTGGTGTYRCQFNTSGISNTYRIAYVRFEIRAKGFDWSWQQPTIDLEWWNGGTKLGRIGTISPPQDYVFRTYSFGPYYFDFYNEGSWLQPEIVNLDSNTSRNMGFTLNYACAISRITMIVGVVTEDRAAVGIGTKVTVPPSGTQTGQVITMKTPLNVSNWVKANSKTYMHVVRRLEDPFSSLSTITPAIPYLDSGSASPHNEGNDYAVTLEDKAGRVSSSTLGTATHGLWMAVAGAQSADSMPYWDLDAKPCHATSTLKQGINGASVQAYKRVKFLVGISTTPTASLSIKIKRSSDNVQMGGTGTLAVADLADSSIATLVGSRTLFDGRTMSVYSVTVTLASTATLAAATNYYVEWTSSTTEAWFPLWLDSTASHGLTGNVTYGGTTNQADVAGVTTAGVDFAVTLGSVPTALAGLTVTLDTVSLPNGYSTQYARVAWTASSLTSSFLRYEVERSEDAGASWTTIGYVTSSENTHNYFDDYEGARGVATLYRVRVVRSDGAQSDWTTAGSSVTPASISGVVVFCANAQPSLTTGYPVLGPETSYKMLNGDKLVLVEMHGRDYQVAFKQSENRGVQWPFEILVHANPSVAPATGAGIRAFDTLAAIARAEAPYLCLLTFDGERLFGALAFPEGVRRYQYTAKVVFTQTAGSPSVVTV